MTRSYLVKILLLVALITPICVLLGKASYIVITHKNIPSFILPIGGYDPRDPVYGHYLQFRINWPFRKKDPLTCHESNPKKCLVCFQGRYSKPVIAIISEEQAKTQSCLATHNQLSYFNWTSPLTEENPPTLSLQDEPHRFYIDEKHGKPLEDYFRAHPTGFAIQVKIHNNQIHVEKLLIDGRDYRETLRPTP